MGAGEHQRLISVALDLTAIALLCVGFVLLLRFQERGMGAGSLRFICLGLLLTKLVCFGGMGVVLIMQAMRFLVGHFTGDGTEALMVIVLTAAAFVLAYCWGSLLLHLLLNRILWRLFRAGETVGDKTTCLLVRQRVQENVLFHRVLFGRRGTSPACVLDRVCPLTDGVEES
jgi:hypothetical protein